MSATLAVRRFWRMVSSVWASANAIACAVTMTYMATMPALYH